MQNATKHRHRSKCEVSNKRFSRQDLFPDASPTFGQFSDISQTAVELCDISRFRGKWSTCIQTESAKQWVEQSYPTSSCSKGGLHVLLSRVGVRPAAVQFQELRRSYWCLTDTAAAMPPHLRGWRGRRHGRTAARTMHRCPVDVL